MQRINVLRQAVNIEALHDDLKDLAGDNFAGLSTRPGWVTAHLASKTDDTLIEQIRSAILNHDATQQSMAQQTKETRQVALENLRQQNPAALNPDAFSTQLPLIRQLAAKVAWLEREIRAIQNLETGA
ncbi:MAG: hypothetical protein ACPG7F_12410 [Aggregatilineales bacterium]